MMDRADEGEMKRMIAMLERLSLGVESNTI
jgi:hypothetical protein